MYRYILHGGGALSFALERGIRHVLSPLRPEGSGTTPPLVLDLLPDPGHPQPLSNREQVRTPRGPRLLGFGETSCAAYEGGSGIGREGRRSRAARKPARSALASGRCS